MLGNLSLKKSVIHLHLKSAEHAAAIEHLKSKEKEQSIINMVEKYDDKVHLAGEKLPDSVRVHRIKVLTCFLRVAYRSTKLIVFVTYLKKHLLIEQQQSPR